MSVTEAITLIAAVGAFIVAIAGAFVSVWNAIHIGQVHTLANSMASRTEALQRALGHAEGSVATASLSPAAQSPAEGSQPTRP